LDERNTQDFRARFCLKFGASRLNPTANRKSKIKNPKAMAKNDKAAIRRAVHRRIRRKVSGTAEKPRLAIFRSLNHIYAQVIDDEHGHTLASASTLEKDLKGNTGGNIEAAQRIGKTIAERALAAGVTNVVFDRGGYVYHGRIKALAEAARAAGLNPNEATAAAAPEEQTEA
jgi:large subunit ribosomal protein L18